MSRRISLLCTPHSTPWPSRASTSYAYYISCRQATVPRMHMFECSSGRCFRNVSSGFAGAGQTAVHAAGLPVSIGHATPTQRSRRCSPLRSSSTSSSSPSLAWFSAGCCCRPLRQWPQLRLKAPPPLCSHESAQPKPTSTLDLRLPPAAAGTARTRCSASCSSSQAGVPQPGAEDGVVA